MKSFGQESPCREDDRLGSTRQLSEMSGTEKEVEASARGKKRGQAVGFDWGQLPHNTRVLCMQDICSCKIWVGSKGLLLLLLLQDLVVRSTASRFSSNCQTGLLLEAQNLHQHRGPRAASHRACGSPPPYCCYCPRNGDIRPDDRGPSKDSIVLMGRATSGSKSRTSAGSKVGSGWGATRFRSRSCIASASWLMVHEARASTIPQGTQHPIAMLKAVYLHAF